MKRSAPARLAAAASPIALLCHTHPTAGVLQVRRLAVALVRTFHGPHSRHAAAVEEQLGSEERWAAHEQLLEAAQAAMGLAA